MAYYRLYCEICGFTTVTEGGVTSLKEFKRSKIQTKLPTLDEDNKFVKPEFMSLPKKYKCPKCGRLVAAKHKMKEIDEIKAKNPDEQQDNNKRSQGGFERL